MSNTILKKASKLIYDYFGFICFICIIFVFIFSFLNDKKTFLNEHEQLSEKISEKYHIQLLERGIAFIDADRWVFASLGELLSVYSDANASNLIYSTYRKRLGDELTKARYQITKSRIIVKYAPDKDNHFDFELGLLSDQLDYIIEQYDVKKADIELENEIKDSWDE